MPSRAVVSWYFIVAFITDHDVKQERQTTLVSFMNRKVRLKSWNVDWNFTVSDSGSNEVSDG